MECLFTSNRDFGECVAGIINDKIQFVIQDDSNITRCSVVEWWADFIETVRRLKLVLLEKPVLAADRLAGFFETLSACVYVMSESYGKRVWKSIYERGKERAGPRHRQMIDDFKNLQKALA